MGTVIRHGHDRATSGAKVANTPHSDLVLPYGDQFNDRIVR